jgi:hypothetical protein
MAVDTRQKNVNWYVAAPQGDGSIYPDVHDGVILAVLMDIRDELQTLNRLLHCSNFTGMPHDLRQINRRLAQTTKLPKGRTKG